MKQNKPRFIGITGGVGAGKSAILRYIEKNFNARVMLADEIAHNLMESEDFCAKSLKKLFKDDDVFLENGSIQREQMAKVIFSDKKKRKAVNQIVHPAVKQYVIQEVEKEREKGCLDFLILEAALLIEENYDEICDELWYIYTSEANRRTRLKQNRGYSDEKINHILQSQQKEEVYRKYCREVIDNNGNLEDTYKQMKELLVTRLEV